MRRPVSADRSRLPYRRRHDHRRIQVEQLEARLALSADLKAISERPLPEKVTKEIVPGEIIVAFSGDVQAESVRQQLANRLELAQVDLGGQVSVASLLTFENEQQQTQSLLTLQLGEFQDVETAGDILRPLPGIAWVQPNFAYRGGIKKLTPNDPSYSSQYHHALMQNNLAWDTTNLGGNVVVAVTDDGMQLNHPDLAANLFIKTVEVVNGIDDDGNGFIDDRNGWDFVSNDANPSPVSSGDDHGTHVAGIVAARTNNGLGVAGTAGNIKVMPIRWAGSDGGFTSTIIANSLKYASDNGAKIVNSSYEADYFPADSVIMAGFQYMYDAGVLHFNAGDNEAIRDAPNQGLHQTLLVASSNNLDQLSDFSNFGIGTDITAPGENILSTVTGSTYATFSGTSMAAPNAAAVAALIWSAYPTLTRDQVAARLMGTVTNINAQNPTFIGQLGGGRANSFNAVPSATLPVLTAPKINFLREVPTTTNPTIFPISRIRVSTDKLLDRASVETAANWSLVSAGADATLGTGDDVPVTLTRARPYLVGSNDVFFTFPTLAAGSYRFRAVSGGLRDPFSTALDGDGNGTAGGDYVKDFTVITGNVLLSADFSGTTGAPNSEGFTATGAWHLSTGHGNAPGHSADDSFYFGSGENINGGGIYANNSSGTLTSPLINLTAVTGQIALQFNHLLASEPPYDFAYVYVIDGASTIELAKSGTSLAHTQAGFEPVQLDLSAYAGKSIRIRFSFTADVSENFEGWYIDDVTIRSAPAASIAGTVFNDFNGNRVQDGVESGLISWTVYLDTNNNGTRELGANIAATDVPKPIPDLSLITSSLTVLGAQTITDLNVTVSLTHTYVGDLDIFLISPSGTRVELATDVGGGGSGFTNTVFDQQAQTLISAGSSPFSGSFRPEGSLSVLNGTSPIGTWRLEVRDQLGGDSGTLTGWSLQINPTEPAVVTPFSGAYQFTGLTPGDYVVRQVLQGPWTQTAPLSGAHQVSVSMGQALTGLDFGNVVGNTPPTISDVPDQTLTEDGSAAANFTVSDVQTASASLVVIAASSNSTLLPLSGIVFSGTGADRTVTFTPASNEFGTSTVMLYVYDGGVMAATDTVLVTVNPLNDRPTFTKGADPTVTNDAGPQSIANWATAISPGPANESAQTVSFQVTGNTNSSLFSAGPLVAANGTLTFTPAAGATGSATITLVAQDTGGVGAGSFDTSLPQTFTITINPPATFQVSSYTPTTTGAVLNLNRDVLTSELNLYDVSPSLFGPADVTLVGATVGNVKGSLVVDPNLRQLTFVKTTGLLEPDTYTLTVRSAANGLQDTSGVLLDGDVNGTPGGDYVRNFIVDPPAATAVTLSIGNFARGPGQPVNLPADVTTGLPVSFSDGAGITSASFELRYDPTLLTIPHGTGAAVAPGLTGASVTIDTATTPGVAAIQFTSATPLPGGTTRFIDLLTVVPATALYQSKHVLDIANASLNGGAIPALDDDAVHVVAFFGDTTASGSYSSSDASRIMRLAAGADAGVEEYRLLDAAIIADMTGNGGFSGTDTSRIQQVVVGVQVPEVPLPLPGASVLFGGPDPKLSIPADLVAAPGAELTIPVHIDSIVDLTGDGLESAELIIHYDPTVLDVTSVTLGSLVAERGWMIASRIEPLAGRVLVSLGGMTTLEGFFAGEFVQLHAAVKADAPSGSFPLNLAASARDLAIRTQLNEGWLTLIPAPTDAANDPGVDGLVTILPAADAPTPRQQRGEYLANLLQLTATADSSSTAATVQPAAVASVTATSDLALLQLLAEWQGGSNTDSALSPLARIRRR